MEISAQVTTMDCVTPSFSSVPSTSSLPSLSSRQSSSSITDLDTSSPEAMPLALQPQQGLSNTTSYTETAMCGTSLTSVASSSSLSSTTSHPQRTSPFKSFRSLNPSGPFRPLFRGSSISQQFHVIVATSFACLAAASAKQTNRKLEDEDNEWTGEWNGEWTADQGDDYVYSCNGDNCNDDNTRSSGGMWLDDVDPLALTPDQIITYVTVGILSFMILLCCVCYPEILMVAYAKMCACCCCGRGVASKGGTGVSREVGVGDEEGGDYVGGKQDSDKKKKKKKKKRRSSRTRGDVELV